MKRSKPMIEDYERIHLIEDVIIQADREEEERRIMEEINRLPATVTLINEAEIKEYEHKSNTLPF